MKSKSILTNCLILLSLLQPTGALAQTQNPSQDLACEVVRIEARSDLTTYVGSAVPISIAGVTVLLTADHILPFELTFERMRDFTITVVNSRGEKTRASVLRRDWASDLMVLALSHQSRAPRPCSPGQIKNDSRLRVVGYPKDAGTLVSREAELLEAANSSIRVARALDLIKFVGGADNGMSGGALLSERGEFLGLSIQDWYSENHRFKGGGYAIPARFAVEQAGRMLSQTGVGNESLDIPLPFRVDRSRIEIEALGMRFRQVMLSPGAPGNPIGGGHPDGIGGGHPDGIGGRIEHLTALDVVALTGAPLPASLLPMERIIRRILNDRAGRVWVVRTEDGRSMRNLVELGRALIRGEVPPFEFVIKQPSSNDPNASSAPQSGTLDSLSEKLLLQAFQISERDSRIAEAAQSLRRAYSSPGNVSSLERAVLLLAEIRKQKEAISQITELGPPGVKLLIDFNVTRIELEGRLQFQAN